VLVENDSETNGNGSNDLIKLTTKEPNLSLLITPDNEHIFVTGKSIKTISKSLSILLQAQARRIFGFPLHLTRLIL
jgi:hypothetical protein